MGVVARVAGWMLVLFILKIAILWFCLVLFLQVISNICKSLLTLSNNLSPLMSENKNK